MISPRNHALLPKAYSESAACIDHPLEKREFSEDRSGHTLGGHNVSRGISRITSPKFHPKRLHEPARHAKGLSALLSRTARSISSSLRCPSNYRYVSLGMDYTDYVKGLRQRRE